MSERWFEDYDLDSLDADADLALRMMIGAVLASPSDGVPLDETNDDTASLVLNVGYGGYLWRLAEEGVGRRIDDDVIEGVRVAVGSFPGVDEYRVHDDDGSTDKALLLYYIAASSFGKEGYPVWRTSPGHLAWGFDFFRRGRRWVIERAQAGEFGHERVAEGDLWYAFQFGVALREAERCTGG